MNALRLRAVLFIALSITILGMAVLLATLVPEDIYPYGERLRDYALFVQGIVAAVAIGAGAYVADRRFQIFRTFQPHLTIEHRVSYRGLSENYIHFEVTADLRNSSRVQVQIREAFVLLQGVAPISDERAEYLYSQTFEENSANSIQWEPLVRFDRTWEETGLVVEPGETHSETFEFIIEKSSYGSILAYTYFYNPAFEQDPRAGRGWTATTVHDIVVS